MIQQLVMKITLIGIDPGYDRVGWAVATVDAHQLEVIAFDCIQTNKTQHLFDRYVQIEKQLQKVIDTYKPEEAALESLFFFKNQKTALHVSEARGIIISNFLRNKMKIAEYTPLQIKQALTGYGKADKKAVEKMVRLQIKHKADHLPKLIDDTIDAIGVVITHASSRRMKKL